MPRVDILLATYQGARHLPEQLASLAAQTHADWHLILRDDGSRDGSPELVRDWAQAGGHALTVLDAAEGNLGPARSFARLLEASEAPCFAFSDQDDRWHPTKIARLLDTVRAAEAEAGAETPILAHCDLRVVDRDLSPTAPSFWDLQGIRRGDIRRDTPPGAARGRLLLQNTVTGCAMLGNAALRRAALPQPEVAMMHDWWLALVAAYAGEIRALPEALIDYRQHGGNTLGAKDWSPAAVLRRFRADPGAAIERTRRVLSGTRAQARALADLHGAQMPPEDRRLVEAYAALGTQGPLARKTFLHRHGLAPRSLLRTAVLVALM